MLTAEKPLTASRWLLWPWAACRAAAAICGVVAVLAAIVLPGFSGLFRKSAEGAMKGSLAAMRQAIENYRRAHGGRAPESLEDLVGAGDLAQIPPLWPRFSGIAHPTSAAATVVAEAAMTDSGRWAYVVSASSPGLTGALFIDCTHTDTRGSAWTSY